MKGLRAIVSSSKSNGKGVPPEVLYNVARRWDDIESTVCLFIIIKNVCYFDLNLF